MKSFIVRILLSTAVLAVIGCSSTPPAAEGGAAGGAAASGASGASGQTAIRRYPMHGKIISVNAADKAARIEAGPIGDWMGAMTMNYTIKDDEQFPKLTPGETFDATVFVNGDDFWVGEIKPVQ